MYRVEDGGAHPGGTQPQGGPEGSLGPLLSLKIHQGKGRDRIRQEASHVHSVVFSPDDQYALTSDLGNDTVKSYYFDGTSNALLNDVASKDRIFDPTLGSDLLTEESIYRSNGGSGPRHLTFHPQGEVAYVVNELTSTIDFFGFNKASGELTYRAGVEMLPEDYEAAEWTTNWGRWAADVAVHPSGKFLYASNRLHDSIVVYPLDAEGTPDKPTWYKSEGVTPRSFNITCDGKIMIVAHQHSHDITTFLIDQETGEPVMTDPKFGRMKVPYASCVQSIKNNIMIPAPTVEEGSTSTKDITLGQ